MVRSGSDLPDGPEVLLSELGLHVGAEEVVFTGGDELRSGNFGGL